MTDTLIRGDTSSWTIPILDSDGEPMPLNGCTVTVTCKTKATSATALFQHSLVLDAEGEVELAAGMELGPDGATAGIVVETLTAAESEAFAPGKYAYDLEVRLPDGRVYTPLLAIPVTVVADFTYPTEV